MNLLPHIEKVRLIFALTILLQWSATAGEFLRSSGTSSWNKGGKQITITLSVDSSGGQLSPTVTWRSGSITQSDAMTSTHLQPGRWFTFIENETTIWIFDGATSLRLVLATDKSLTDTDAAEKLRKCPPEVRDALPESVRKKYK